MVVPASLLVSEHLLPAVSKVDWSKHCLAVFGTPEEAGTKNLVAAPAQVFTKMGGYTVTPGCAWSSASEDLTNRLERTYGMIGQERDG
jgi:hypothetical protein